MNMEKKNTRATIKAINMNRLFIKNRNKNVHIFIIISLN